MNKTDLQRLVIMAFEDVPYPGDDNIGDPLGRDDAEDVTEWLRGISWHTLVSRRLWRIGLYFMTPHACHYYLPGYLLGALEDTEGEAMGAILLCLHPRNADSKYPEARHRFLTIVFLLSPEQKQVIRAVLVYAQDELLSYLIENRERDPELSVDQDLNEITDRERKEERVYWDERIQETYAEFVPLIEYWSRV